METGDAEPVEGGGGGREGVGEEGVPTEQPQQPIIQPHIQAPSHASRRIGMGMQFEKMGGPTMGLPGLGGASSSTEELVHIIVKSLQEIGVDEMDIREIMQLVKVKVKKLRYSIRLPGEDREFLSKISHVNLSSHSHSHLPPHNKQQRDPLLFNLLKKKEPLLLTWIH
jgi:hypothetical protein